MNRRELLLGGAAVGVVTAVGVGAAESLMFDGTGDYVSVPDDRYLLGGDDWTIDMWISRPSDEDTVISHLTLRSNVSADNVECLDWDAVRVVVQKHEKRVPVGDGWHHMYAHNGHFFVDGVEHNTKLDEKYVSQLEAHSA